MKRMNLIERQALADEIRSLRMTTTKIQVGEAVFTAENARDFRDNVLRIIDEQPAVEPAHQTADEMFQEQGYEKITYNGHVSYDSMVSGDVVAVENGQATFSDVEGTFAFCVDVDVVKATARLIEELEVATDDA